MTATRTTTPLDGNTPLDDLTRIITMHIQEGQAGAHVMGLLYKEGAALDPKLVPGSVAAVAA